jgi:LysW-gamma-L-lysine carboxypeptidase
VSTTVDVAELLADMVAVESLSGRESRLARLLVDRMERAGFRAHVDAAGNAVGIRAGARLDLATDPAARWRDVVLLGHLDTVPGRIPVRVEDGKLFGRGAVDAKGPLAAFVAAAAALDPPQGTRLVVIGAVEEESATSRGARHAATCFQPDACLIGEPSGADALTLGYKGRLLVDAHFEQKAGHSAGPVAAVGERAVAFWNAVARHAAEFNAAPGRAALFDQLLPSLRTIRTGSDGLADTADMTLGLRLPEGFDVAAYERELRQRDRAADLRAYGHEVAFRADRSSPWARAFAAARRARGAEPRFKLKTGTSDMNVLAPHWHCPFAAYGPGDSTLDHTPDEHVALDEVREAVEVLKGMLVEMGCGGIGIGSRDREAGATMHAHEER